MITESMRPGRPALAPLRGSGRLLRVAALGGSSLLLATTAHLFGGGRLPSAAVLVITALLLGLLATVLTGRRLRGPLLLAVLAGQQFALHLVFDLASTGPILNCASAMSSMGANSHGAVCAPAAPMVTSMAGMAGMSGGHLLSAGALVMLFAHLSAVLATAWLLTRGEAALWRLSDRLAAAVTGPGARPSRRRVLPTVLRAFRKLIVRFDQTWTPRGPPRSVSALRCV